MGLVDTCLVHYLIHLSFGHKRYGSVTHFCTLGYCMSVMALVESLCLSFRCRGHMLSTQSIRSTWNPQSKLSGIYHRASLVVCACAHAWKEMSYWGRSLDEMLQFSMTELKTDDVVQLLPFWGWSFIISPPLTHWHLHALLSAYIHHVNHPSTAYQRDVESRV